MGVGSELCVWYFQESDVGKGHLDDGDNEREARKLYVQSADGQLLDMSESVQDRPSFLSPTKHRQVVVQKAVFLNALSEGILQPAKTSTGEGCSAKTPTAFG